MQAGVHSSWGLVGDLDGIFQNASGDHVLLWAGSRFPRDEEPIVWMTVGRRRLQETVESGQPTCHQVDILGSDRKKITKFVKWLSNSFRGGIFNKSPSRY